MGTTFGGNWTEKKLEMLRKYLVAYATIMKKKHFLCAYIDAFAGSGYREQQTKDDASEPLFPEFADPGSPGLKYLEGSARIALQVQPKFDKYIFLEQQGQAFRELSTLPADFPDRANTIELIQIDANTWLKGHCLNNEWSRERAVVFLDPFGMQVRWETIEAIAATQAIDLWVLFPLGVAVNRLLRKDGQQIEESWRIRLNDIFGTEDWHSRFYAPAQDLFGEDQIRKTVNLEAIGQFYNERLREVFGKDQVAPNPRPLLNSRNNPLYLFCFAAGNPKGAKIAVKIAQHILKHT